MKTTKIAFLLVLFLAAATMAASAQTQVFVPGNASGYFGNPADQINPLVSAITVNGPGTITVTYVSGTVDIGGVEVDPNGITQKDCPQTPLQEAIGISGGTCYHVGGLIGVFAPASTVSRSGFTAVDGTKGTVRIGIMPGLFFIGTSKTFEVKGAGTLFLGINDEHVSDNSGGFTVSVSVQ